MSRMLKTQEIALESDFLKPSTEINSWLNLISNKTKHNPTCFVSCSFRIVGLYHSILEESTLNYCQLLA
jgi:hypothetical protein